MDSTEVAGHLTVLKPINSNDTPPLLNIVQLMANTYCFLNAVTYCKLAKYIRLKLKKNRPQNPPVNFKTSIRTFQYTPITIY
ncbi:hypothetical protein BH09BAC4_BH09BAC4_04530 [soil metagenome]